MTTVISNKRRGRAFQAELARMANGVNVGTLGGEDIMHPEFSYEAKTYNPKCKTHKGRDWKGEELLSELDKGVLSNGCVILHVDSPTFSPLVLMRWHWWSGLIDGTYWAGNITPGQIYFTSLNTFIGNTWMDQAENNCPEAKVPVLVVHTTGIRHPKNVVVLRKIYWGSLVEKFLDKRF